MEEEVELAEELEGSPTENVGKTDEEVWKDAASDGGGKGNVGAVGAYQEDCHHHVHGQYAVDGDVGHGQLSLLFLNSVQVG